MQPAPPSVLVSSDLDITHLFDANGVLLLERFQAAVRELLQKYQRAAESAAPSKKVD